MQKDNNKLNTLLNQPFEQNVGHVFDTICEIYDKVSTIELNRVLRMHHPAKQTADVLSQQVDASITRGTLEEILKLCYTKSFGKSKKGKYVEVFNYVIAQLYQQLDDAGLTKVAKVQSIEALGSGPLFMYCALLPFYAWDNLQVLPSKLVPIKQAQDKKREGEQDDYAVMLKAIHDALEYLYADWQNSVPADVIASNKVKNLALIGMCETGSLLAVTIVAQHEANMHPMQAAFLGAMAGAIYWRRMLESNAAVQLESSVSKQQYLTRLDYILENINEYLVEDKIKLMKLDAIVAMAPKFKVQADKVFRSKAAAIDKILSPKKHSFKKF